MRFQKWLLNSSSLMATNNGRRVEFPISGAEKKVRAEVNCWNSKVKTDKSVRLKRMKCSGCDGVDNKLITRNSQTIDWMIFFRCTRNTSHVPKFVFIFIGPSSSSFLLLFYSNHRPNRVLIKKFQFFSSRMLLFKNLCFFLEISLQSNNDAYLRPNLMHNALEQLPANSEQHELGFFRHRKVNQVEDAGKRKKKKMKSTLSHSGRCEWTYSLAKLASI